MSDTLPYGNWTPALFRPHSRMIGGIVAEVTITESHEDDIQITEHPVEQGAPIADHAFKRPSQVSIRAGWSVGGSVDLSAETGVYGLLLSWQAALMPFDVITGKRGYANMLIERLAVETDSHSEWALLANIVCRQVIIVTTQVKEAVGQSESAGNQASPETTGQEKDRGEQQPTANPKGEGAVQTQNGANGAAAPNNPWVTEPIENPYVPPGATTAGATETNIENPIPPAGAEVPAQIS